MAHGPTGARARCACAFVRAAARLAGRGVLAPPRAAAAAERQRRRADRQRAGGGARTTRRFGRARGSARRGDGGSFRTWSMLCTNGAILVNGAWSVGYYREIGEVRSSLSAAAPCPSTSETRRRASDDAVARRVRGPEDVRHPRGVEGRACEPSRRTRRRTTKCTRGAATPRRSEGFGALLRVMSTDIKYASATCCACATPSRRRRRPCPGTRGTKRWAPGRTTRAYARARAPEQKAASTPRRSAGNSNTRRCTRGGANRAWHRKAGRTRRRAPRRVGSSAGDVERRERKRRVEVLFFVET